MPDETQVSQRSMDYQLMREFAEVKTMLTVVVEDVREIKVDNKEIKKEVYGVEGYNGLRGKTKLTEEKLSNHISLSHIRWHETLWAFGVAAAGITILFTAQISDSDALTALAKGLSWLKLEP